MPDWKNHELATVLAGAANVAIIMATDYESYKEKRHVLMAELVRFGVAFRSCTDDMSEDSNWGTYCYGPPNLP